MATQTGTRRKLSVGKIDGLRHLADERGIFCITAMDQRNSLRALVDPNDPSRVTPAQMTDIKLALAETLSPHSTAVLLDPQYGAPQAIVAGALDPHTGLIITLEGDRPKSVGQGRITEIATGFSAAKIRRMGGNAVKLLVRYRPDLTEAAEANRAVIQEVSDQCRETDVPFVLETVTYALDGQTKEDFAREKPSLVIETAKALSTLCDLYKAEFPDDVSFEKDPAVLRQHCQDLDRASVVPWVILSAGADIGPFSQMVEIACQNGASGFLAGRAIWKNYVAIADPTKRRAEIEQKAVYNLGVVTNIAKRDATPWTEHRGVELPKPSDFSLTWYEQY
jgi:tagatose 1,6-diphosphate aldolase